MFSTVQYDSPTEGYQVEQFKRAREIPTTIFRNSRYDVTLHNLMKKSQYVYPAVFTIVTLERACESLNKYNYMFFSAYSGRGIVFTNITLFIGKPCMYFRYKQGIIMNTCIKRST